MCFSMVWLQQVLVLLIVIGAVFAILQIIIPYALKKAGAEVTEGMGILSQVFKIILWALIAIIVVIVCFEAISCLISWGGGTLLPRR